MITTGDDASDGAEEIKECFYRLAVESLSPPQCTYWMVVYFNCCNYHLIRYLEGYSGPHTYIHSIILIVHCVVIGLLLRLERTEWYGICGTVTLISMEP
jgi:hypothetical protein